MAVVTYEDLVETYGNANRAAKALGFARQTISQWKSRGIPFEAQYRIQLKTKGKLKARLPAEREAA
jgi:hypothetical protein